MHFNGSISSTIRNQTKIIPFELQTKTYAQDAWGYYTHEEAYSRTDVNSDARFHVVRQLQQVLSDQLHSVDELQALIERLSSDSVHQITKESPTDSVGTANVLNIVSELYEQVLQLRDAEALADYARTHGVQTMEELRGLIAIDEGSEEAEQLVADFQAEHGRKPELYELLMSRLQSKRFEGFQ